MTSSLPKLSYVLLSHNREKYIRAAIESAFAQDYEGELEYIFSDDCSTDRTFEIIQECVAEYKGERRIVVTQTPRNLHLAGNTNHAVQFVESDWVIRADDDDISHVSRCSVIGKAIAEHPGCRYVFTRMRLFTDKEDAQIHEDSMTPIAAVIQTREFRHGTGCADSTATFAQSDCLHQAWHADIYRIFGALPIDGYYVDDVISHYRAMTLGSGVNLDITTAYIRTASSNMSKGNDTGGRGYTDIMKLEQFHDKYYNIVLSPLKQTKQMLQDYVAPGTMEQLFQEIDLFVKKHEDYSSFWRKGILNRFRVSRKYSRLNLYGLLRCLPMPLFALLLSVIRKFKDKHTHSPS